MVVHLPYAAPTFVVRIPKQVARFVRHLPRDANLVAVDVARLSMVVVCVHLRQRLIALWAAVNIAESAVGFFTVLVTAHMGLFSIYLAVRLLCGL